MDAPEQSPPGIDAEHRSARDRELMAWRLLCADRMKANSPGRLGALDEWFSAARDLRDKQALMTSAAMHSAAQSLREAAALLTASDIPAHGGAARERRATAQAARKAPERGRRYGGRQGDSWTVVAMIWDDLEPHLYLAQVRRDAAPDEVFDVYCEDWPLFCVVHGLQNLPPGVGATH